MKKGRQKVKDFSKKKVKFGKGKKKQAADNVTRATFKAQSIAVPQQLEEKGKGGGPITHRHLSFNDLLKQLSHPKPSVVSDALNGLRELISTPSPVSLLQSDTASLRQLLKDLVPVFLNTDKSVHHSLFLFLKSMFQTTPTDLMAPYIEYLLTGVSASVTHIDLSVRFSGISLVDLFLEYYPCLLRQHISYLLPYYVSLLSQFSPSGGTQRSVKVLDWTKKTVIINQLLSLFKLLTDCSTAPQPTTNDKFESPLIDLEKEVVEIGDGFHVGMYDYFQSSALLLQLSQSAYSLTSSDSLVNNLSTTPSTVASTDIVSSLLTIIMEYWIETIPTLSSPPPPSFFSLGKRKRKSKMVQSQSRPLVVSLLELIGILLEMKGSINEHQRQIVQHHFLPYFPLSQFEAHVNIQFSFLLVLMGGDFALDQVFRFLAISLPSSHQLSHSAPLIIKILKVLNVKAMIPSNSRDSLISFYDSVFRAFISKRMTSSSLEIVLLFLEQVLDGIVRFDKKPSSAFTEFFFHPCLSYLPNLLNAESSVCGGRVMLIKLLLKLINYSLSLRIGSVEKSILDNFNNIYGPDGFITVIPQCLLPPTISLLHHLSVLTHSNMSVLFSLVWSGKLPLSTITSLVHLLHNRCLLLTSDEFENNVVNDIEQVSHHISFLLSLLMTYPLDKLTSLTSKPNKGPLIEPPLPFPAPQLKERDTLIDKPIKVFPLDTVYGIMCLISQRSTPLPPSLSAAISPLLLEIIIAKEMGYVKHEYLDKSVKCLQGMLERNIMNRERFGQLVRERIKTNVDITGYCVDLHV
ncbi:PREDICTED: testis-expressed sequence 10 protein homolog isoform X2 [Amphimedon queenslandica]|uniref:TEX10-like TPR repeats domain-containing protein n=1 Tax=Amphimedon queenslandica TaxID=400682 RepID=A0AAN0K3F2_AMPQE|nr:PREDICTED: testis-expressed sequence 10 protein homolog isoform X2 [Amphimedon queenslandica]|eukprot:XP_019864051.1 PREDICTED: testis-expressed sequence 10 protein homolog isoform X2 [Amphimedon queenslandica]